MRLRFSFLLFALSLGGLAACGGSVDDPSLSTNAPPSAATAPPSEPPASAPPSTFVEATIGDHPMQARGFALKQFFYEAAPGERYGAASIAIADAPSLCTAARPTGEPVVLLTLKSVSRAATVTPGTYDVGASDAPRATIEIVRLHADDCGRDVLETATSGVVHVDLGKPARLEGSFDAVLTKSGSLRGRFAIDACEQAPGGVDPTIRCAL